MEQIKILVFFRNFDFDRNKCAKILIYGILDRNKKIHSIYAKIFYALKLNY